MARKHRYINISLGYFLLVIIFNDFLVLTLWYYLQTPHSNNLVNFLFDFFLYSIQTFIEIIKYLVS